MAPSQTEVADIYNCSLLLICLPRKDERLSRPGCLTYNGRFTYIRLVTRRLQVGLLRRSDGGRGFICGRVALFVRKREKTPTAVVMTNLRKYRQCLILRVYGVKFRAKSMNKPHQWEPNVGLLKPARSVRMYYIAQRYVRAAAWQHRSMCSEFCVANINRASGARLVVNCTAGWNTFLFPQLSILLSVFLLTL